MTTADTTIPTDARPVATKTTLDWRLRFASALLLIQGIFMEGGVFIGFLVLAALGVSQQDAGTHFSFIVPFFQEHLFLMMIMSGVFGALRITGAICVLRNKMWGYALSVTNCVVTMVLMIFMLPAGIADGLLSGTALVLLLMVFYRGKSIT